MPSGSGPQGRFGSVPRGVILHGSRSDHPELSRAQEFDGTSRWAANPSNPLGWTATVSEDCYDRHIDEGAWGYSAFNASTIYLAVEFAQAVEAWPITDPMVNAFCHWYAIHARKRWPTLPLRFPSHSEVEASGEIGHAPSGKTDVFRLHAPRMEDLRARILARLDGQHGIRS